MPHQKLSPDRSDTPDRRERLEIYNGEFQPPVVTPTGFQDEIEPVDATVESMAAAAAVSHQADDAVQPVQEEEHIPDVKSRPNTQPSAKEDDTEDEDEGDRGVIVNANDMTGDLAPKNKKKKKKRKPASKRGMNKPTGFEENFADPPMTPQEYEEQKARYSPDIPFVDRILTAIQRFEQTRKLSPERRNVFYKYLAYGGVDVGPNMFQGNQDKKSMDKDDLTTVMANTSISEDVKASILDPKSQDQDTDLSDLGPPGHQLPDHNLKYTVDFLTTMRAFLSRRASDMFGFETRDRVELVTTTLERFMDYLMQNEVCPEYHHEVLSTRDFCRTAKTELWDCAEAQRLLPGDFNIACSTLFGGNYGRDYDGETYWGDARPGENVFVGLKPEKATQIIGFAIAAAATEEVYAQYHDIMENHGGNFEVVQTINDHGFEIIDVQQPTQECKDLYKNNTEEYRPVGIVHAKLWQDPDAQPEDLTPEEKALLKTSPIKQPHSFTTTFTFFIEASTVLPLLKPGQKIEATIHKLNCGIWFFDEFRRILPDFETWIENEMTYGWREPKALKGSLEFEEDGGAGGEVNAVVGERSDDTGVGPNIDADDNEKASDGDGGVAVPTDAVASAGGNDEPY